MRENMSEKQDRKPGRTGEKKTTGASGKSKAYGKPSTGRKDGKPAAGGKTFGKTAEGKTYGKSVAGGRAFGKTAEGKPYGKPAAGGRAFGKPDEGKAYGKPAAGGRTFRKPAEGRPYGKPGTDRKHSQPAGTRPAKKVAPGEMEGMASRRAALKVIRAVTEEGAYASLALDKTLQGSGLNGADRRLVSRLVYDTLDRMIYLDHMLGQVMAREDTDIKLRNILRLGACQILIEDRIPESAATNTSVQLCVENGMEALKGVCNGILRNLIRRKEELTLPDPETEPEQYFAVKNSLPLWLGTRLREDWGTEEAEQIATWRAPESAITIRRNLLKTDEAGFGKILEKKIWGRTPGDFPGTWKITGAMDIARDADFLEGAFSIQSEPSMAACLAMGVKRGMQVLDCCAAPGGKTCYLSELMGDTGRIQAWDIHDHRVALIAA